MFSLHLKIPPQCILVFLPPIPSVVLNNNEKIVALDSHAEEKKARRRLRSRVASLLVDKNAKLGD